MGVRFKIKINNQLVIELPVHNSWQGYQGFHVNRNIPIFELSVRDELSALQVIFPAGPVPNNNMYSPSITSKTIKRS